MKKRTMPVTVAIDSVVQVSPDSNALKKMVDACVNHMRKNFPKNEVIRSEEVRFGQTMCFVSVLSEDRQTLLESHAFRTFGKYYIRSGTRQFKPKAVKK